MQAGQLYPTQAINFIKSLSPELLFYLNQNDGSVSTGKVSNLANRNQSISGSFLSDSSAASITNQNVRNMRAIQFTVANTQGLSFGNNFGYTDKVTAFILVRRDQTSSSVFPQVFGRCAVLSYYLIMNGSTNKIGFTINTSGGEKTCYITTPLVNGQWYWVFGSYDMNNGNNNQRCSVYTLDGRLFAVATSTQTLAIGTGTKPLEIARDDNRGQRDNITVSMGGIFHRQISLQEELRIVQSLIRSYNL